jgi:ornithine cyclodeaminase
MPAIVTLPEILEAVRGLDPLPLIEDGFVAYSQGRVVVPPIGEMIFDRPPGDVHIKYGYIRSDDYYVTKIASGFADNPKIGLPSGNGLMLLFSQKTSELECLLLDEGYLTNLRTAAAGDRSGLAISLRRNNRSSGRWPAGKPGRTPPWGSKS